MTTASLVVSTYNWKEALALCLQSIAAQKVLPMEVIVADDGSRADTAELIRTMARDFPVPLIHAWQEDDGFRLARVRNLGIAASSGDYVIFLDGDLILHPLFVADHLATIRPDIFLQGGRLNATPEESARLLAGGKPKFSPFMDMEGRFKRKHALRLPWLARRKARNAEGGQMMGCNMGIWRSDLDRVNGFDDNYEGWGREDDDISARLKHAGLVRRPLRFAGLAIHLWHKTRWPDGIPPTEVLPNDRFFDKVLAEQTIRCERGLDAHVSARHAPPRQ
ncbi:glycosyltransferase family 2 protein [Solilutibacter silvestris]|uniref:Glycosyl transferase family 2 n=1 Tax=Solilutibacter silvestris TaxID=1645665 RepID=A0A2K1Q1Q5_9GAMM|nr:glycosyltransferase family 2 protein [Lysobacter silvestris]PNS08964.1 Glycosyl transferase family 2 [Lysobacter silvestris]